MSANHNNCNQQRGSKTSLYNAPMNHKNNRSYPRRKLTSIASCALLFSSASFVLAGCQSTSMPSASTAAQHHEPLFDQDKYPNTDQQAKARLLTAIRQHLATEHVAVAQANYQSAPFIDADSIDAGASGLLRTIIETYAYGLAHADSEYEDLYNDAASTVESEDFSEYSEVERKAVADILAEAGENEASINNDYDNYDGYNDHDYDTDDHDYDTSEGSASGGGILAVMSGFNIKSQAKNYEAMQMAKQQPKPLNKQNKSVAYTGVIGQMLSMLHRTPEQIAAANAYRYQNLTFNSISQYKPKQRQLQSVYSYDYMTPTIRSSIQIPLAFDFNHSRITVDPSAIMPIMALTKPESTPLPEQMTAHTVNFGLPESITTQLPSAVIYDAAIAAIQSSMAELAPEYFSAVDISGDMFAKEVGANRAVKVYFGSQQSGEMIGKVLKYMTRSLQDYVAANPEQYPDGAVLKTTLDKVALYNKGYQSADVGALLQLIEAIGPISFNQSNYYYLDRSNRLLAKQQRLNIGSDLMGAKTTMINQIRYDKDSFNHHALTPLLAASFGADAKPAIDGNAWLAAQRQQKDRLQTARDARYDYSDSDYDSSGYDDSGYDDSGYEDNDYTDSSSKNYNDDDSDEYRSIDDQ